MLKRAVLLICLVFLVASCGPFSNRSAKVTTPVAPTKPLYTGTEFPDIVVPRGMSVVQSKSMVVNTSSFVGGVLTLRGRIKVESLIEFFKNQLEARGWELAGSIHYKNTLLAFQRPNGSCIVYISEPGMGITTEIQIWASELLSPVK